jgi:flagellar protein FlaJ
VTADKNNVYGIQKVSLSDGGYIAIYDEDGVEGELLGRTEYLPPGTHSGLVIPVNQEIKDEQLVRIVAHQETNGNEQFEYAGPYSSGEQAVDKPYKSIGDSDQPGIEVQIQRIDLQGENGSSAG